MTFLLIATTDVALQDYSKFALRSFFVYIS